jgi:superfamily II DNA or RNA helicase
MIDEYIEILMKLTINKEKDKIKTLLEQIAANIKGPVFEEYLKELYSGNGWIAVRNGSKDDSGADILLFHPKTPDTISLIIQAKNHARRLTFDDTKIELVKFEEKSKIKYKCNSYILVSIEGFVKEAKDLADFNMRLESWRYIEGLIDRYSTKRKSEPEIELLAHNKRAYNDSKELFIHSNKVAVVHATGTGKSYIILKFLSDFIDKRCLVLAPSKYILKQIKSKFIWSLQNTKMMTYAKLARISEKEMEDFKFDFIVLDEFHRCGAKEWGKGVQILLNNNHDALILGTSATPIRYLDGNKDMSDQLFDSNVSSSLSLADAIAKNILPMPIYVSALYTIDNELKNLEEKINLSDDLEKDSLLLQLLEYKKNWEKSRGIPEIIKKYVKNDNNKFIVFCEDKKHLSNMEVLVKMWFYKAQPEKRARDYRVVSGDKQSDNELNNFKLASNKNEIHLLFVIDMLNEGIHIDDISGVILLRNTTSPRIFYQQIGRALQAGSIGTKPLIFDFVNNFNSIGADDFISDLNKSKELEGQKRTALGLEESSTEFTIFDETKEEFEFFKEIETRLRGSWELKYEQLKEFYKKNGHFKVSKIHFKELHYWVVKQREFYKKGLLVKDRVDKLNELNFIWDADELWLIRFEYLKDYYEEFGTFKVPRGYKINGFTLENWVNKLKRLYTNGKLTNEQVELLESIGFSWENLREKKWDKMYEELIEFKREFGHCDVSRRANEDKLKLAIWTYKQRKEHREGKLTVDRIRKLNEIGFKFVIPEFFPRKSFEWYTMYNQLVEFKKENGHCDISEQSHKDKKELVQWAVVQRRLYKTDKLSDERMEKLNEIGFKF